MTAAPQSFQLSDLLAKVGGNTPNQRWIRGHVDYAAKDWCLIWPFSRTTKGDYPSVGSPKVLVHRFMCEYRNGPPPTPKHHAGHSCDRGPDGCVNPQHLLWQTASENQLLRHQQHGPGRRSKLTPVQVDEIRALNGRATVADIAQQYDVCENTISFILAGKTWKNTSSLVKRIFSSEEVRLIRSTPYSVKSARQWAAELGVTVSQIEHCRRRGTYKWVTP